MSATSKRARYRKIANRHRAKPGDHGLRPWRVYVSTGTWSVTTANEFGDGTRTDSDVEVLENGQPPKVREVGDEAIALSSDLSKGDYVVGPITPVVGTAWATLIGSAITAGQTFRMKLVHSETAETIHCMVKDSSMDRALRYVVTVSPVRANS
jgi:hypothetical protein